MNRNKRSKLCCIRAVESLREREKERGERERNEEYLPWEPYILLFLLTGNRQQHQLRFQAQSSSSRTASRIETTLPTEPEMNKRQGYLELARHPRKMEDGGGRRKEIKYCTRGELLDEWCGWRRGRDSGEVAGSFENRRCAVLCCCAFLCAAGLRLFLPSLKRREHIGRAAGLVGFVYTTKIEVEKLCIIFVYI